MILSVDSDTLVYGIENLICEIDLHTGVCFNINYTILLKKMGMNPEEFTDFCILCGTDYNSNIFKVGIKGALKYIKKYKSIENLMENETKHDYSSIEKFQEVRDLFNLVDKPCGIKKNGEKYTIEKLSVWRPYRKGQYDDFNTQKWDTIMEELEIEFTDEGTEDECERDGGTEDEGTSNDD